MSMPYRRVIVVISAADRDRANRAALQFDPAGGERTFTVPLNATGDPADPPTHYWASAAMTEETWRAIQALVPMFPGAVAEPYDLDAEPTKPQAVLTRLSLQTLRRKDGL